MCPAGPAPMGVDQGQASCGKWLWEIGQWTPPPIGVGQPTGGGDGNGEELWVGSQPAL